MKRKLFSVLLTAALLLSATVPAFADDDESASSANDTSSGAEFSVPASEEGPVEDETTFDAPSAVEGFTAEDGIASDFDTDTPGDADEIAVLDGDFAQEEPAEEAVTGESAIDEEPVAEDVPETADEPVTEDVPEIVEETVAEGVPETVEEPVAEDVPEIDDEPVAANVPETVEEPVTANVPETVEEPVAEDVPEIVEEPVTETVEIPVTRSVSGTRSQSVTEDAPETVEEPVVEDVPEAVEEPVAAEEAVVSAEAAVEEPETVDAPVAEDVPETVDGYSGEKSIQVVDNRMIQILYTDDNENSLLIRKEAGSADISGDYNDYDEINTIFVGEYSVTLKGNNGTVSTAIWVNDGYSYAVNADAPISTEDMIALIAAIN